MHVPMHGALHGMNMNINLHTGTIATPPPPPPPSSRLVNTSDPPRRIHTQDPFTPNRLHLPSTHDPPYPPNKPVYTTLLTAMPHSLFTQVVVRTAYTGYLPPPPRPDTVIYMMLGNLSYPHYSNHMSQ